MPAHRTLFFRILLALCLAGPASLPAAASISPGKYAVAEVTDRIEAKDCAGAVAALKTGLKLRRYPKPEGIAPDAEFSVRYVFVLD